MSHQKRLGQFFTPPEVARALVSWLNLLPSERLLDPSCGDGRFLRCHRRAVGVEVDPVNAAKAREAAPGALVHGGDFFTWANQTKERFSGVAGNPPFIRYQSFTGHTRQIALAAAARLGAKFSALTSSWAPFLVVASSLLTRGGNMAFVVPAEIGHATYARPLIRALCGSFGRVHVVACREKLFPHLSEDCWLLHCCDYGASTSAIALTVCERFGCDSEPPQTTRLVQLSEWEGMSARLRPFILPEGHLSLYRTIITEAGAVRLGNFASASVGYVTGGNDFFHLRPSEVRRREIPDTVLRAAVRKSVQLPMSVIDGSVVERWIAEDEQFLLLDLSRTRRIPKSVERYLAERGDEVREGYKCRNRDPWFVIPDVIAPDAFLSVMSTGQPLLVRNEAECVCTNTLLGVHFRDKVDAAAVQQGWRSSFAALGAEIEGHPLGGGMLKLEPGEAARVPVPLGELNLPRADAQVVEDALSTMRRWRHYAQPRSLSTN